MGATRSERVRARVEEAGRVQVHCFTVDLLCNVT
jgi:hypothetical protein